MKFELPLGKSPLTCYPNYGAVFSILDVYSKDYIEWIYNYFIQLTVPNNHDLGHRIDFSIPRLYESLPWLNAERLDRKFAIDLCNHFTDFLLHSINHGKYVYVLLDTYYNKNYSTYKMKHLLHEHLIYGYDKERKVFLFADNLNMGKHGFGLVEFEAIENANASVLNNKLVDWNDGIYLFSYRINYDYGMYTFKDHYKHPYNFNLTKKLIRDYLEERETEKDWTLPYSLVGENIETTDKCWGLGIYKYLIEYVRMIRDGAYIEMRAFYVLYEHKKILKEIAQYIFQVSKKEMPKELKEKCYESIKVSSIINGLIIKYSLNKQEELLYRINSRLNILYNNDIFILHKLECEISKNII